VYRGKAAARVVRRTSCESVARSAAPPSPRPTFHSSAESPAPRSFFWGPLRRCAERPKARSAPKKMGSGGCVVGWGRLITTPARARFDALEPCSTAHRSSAIDTRSSTSGIGRAFVGQVDSTSRTLARLAGFDARRAVLRRPVIRSRSGFSSHTPDSGSARSAIQVHRRADQDARRAVVVGPPPPRRARNPGAPPHAAQGPSGRPSAIPRSRRTRA